MLKYTTTIRRKTEGLALVVPERGAAVVPRAATGVRLSLFARRNL